MKKLTIEVHEQKPKNFQTAVDVAICYIESNGLLLFLQCGPSKEEVGFWGVPGGKIERDEAPIDGAKRELFEETGIQIPSHQLEPVGVLYIRKPKSDHVFHLFQLNLSKIPPICLSNEHLNYKWASNKEIEEMPLIAGTLQILQKTRSQEWKNRSI